MSNSTPKPTPNQGAPAPAQPAPAGAPQPGKGGGLPPLAWVGIGCGALLVLILGGCTVLGFFVSKGVKKVAEDEAFRNKVIGAATGTEVTKDEETGEMVMRDKETGESVAFGMDTSKDGGSFTVRNPKTGEELKIGGSKEVPKDFPKAVPVYKGAEVEGSSTFASPDGNAYTLALTAKGTVDAVTDFYGKALDKAGYESVAEMTLGKDRKHLSYKHKTRDKATVGLTVGAKGEGKVLIHLQVVDPKE